MSLTVLKRRPPFKESKFVKASLFAASFCLLK